MAEAKVSIKIGSIEFAGEGDSKWLESQLDKVIERAPDLMRLAPSKSDGGTGSHAPMGDDPEIAKKALGVYLKEKNANSPARKKFLATAVWLEAKGKNRLKPGDVTSALRENNQTRLANASKELGTNVQKGYCERDGDQFFVTEEGKSSL